MFALGARRDEILLTQTLMSGGYSTLSCRSRSSDGRHWTAITCRSPTAGYGPCAAKYADAAIVAPSTLRSREFDAPKADVRSRTIARSPRWPRRQVVFEVVECLQKHRLVAGYAIRERDAWRYPNLGQPSEGSTTTSLICSTGCVSV